MQHLMDGQSARPGLEFRASILIVDDRPANLVALEATLVPLGERIVRATSGEEALKHLLLDDFALIILDVQMPGMDGFETAALIKEHPRTRHVPIIFMTAISREGVHLFRGYQHGAVDYLLKPVDPGILRSKVAVFIDLWRKEKKLHEQTGRLHERERQEQERRVGHRFRELLDALPLCVWALRADGRIDFHNAAWRRYAGLDDKQKQEDMSPDLLLHPEDRERVLPAWRRTMSAGERLDIELRLRRADGAYRWHIGSMVPQRDERGVLMGWILTATDIENQKRAEEAYAQLVDQERQARELAEAANRAKDEFLATVSHELRTPLNAMVGWTRMLRARRLTPQKQERALETIERNAQAQAELIEDLLDVSRIITGKLRLDLGPVDLRAVIDAAMESLRPAAESKGITLERKVGDLPQSLIGDPARLEQVVWNLLSNAVKFTPVGGRVEARLGRVDNMVEIAIADNGRGIEPSFMPFVFERFRQYDGSSKRAHGGLGLGLAIVRHLVELHGGTVEVESPGPGAGATFAVRLPIRAVQVTAGATAGADGAAGARGVSPRRTGETAAPVAPEPLAEGPSLGGVRVLVVDDEPDALELLVEVLSQYGAETIVARSADEALAMLSSFAPHVLVSDIGLPGEDGYALIRRVRARPADEGGQVPAAALTAYARSEDGHRAIAAGFQRHAVKPIHPIELARLVAELAPGAGAPTDEQRARPRTSERQSPPPVDPGG
jgi:PAS domain S-box-containing protein